MTDVKTPAEARSTSGGDAEAVRQGCEGYLDSWYAGDVELMERCVHPELAKRFIRRFDSGAEFLEETGATKLLEWTASGAGAGLPRRQVDVTVLDLFWRAAMAKVSSAWGVEY